MSALILSVTIALFRLLAAMGMTSASTPIADSSPCDRGYTIVYGGKSAAGWASVIQVSHEIIKLDYASGPYHREVGADARGAWLIDENGVRYEDHGEHYGLLMTQRALICEDSLAASHNGTTVADPPHGFRAHVTVLPLGRSAVFFDGSSWFTFMVTRELTSSDGLVVPATWTMNGKSDISVTSVKLARDTTSEEQHATMRADVRDEQLPLSILRGRFAVAGMIDGNPVATFFYTGTTGFAISSNLRDYGSQYVINSTAGAAVQSSEQLRVVDEIAIGGSTFKHVVVYVNPALPSDTIVCGGDCLSALRLSLMPRKKVAMIGANGAFACNAHCLHINVWNGRASLSVTIHGKTQKAVIDTGFAGGVRVPPGFATALGITSPLGADAGLRACATPPLLVDIVLADIRVETPLSCQTSRLQASYVVGSATFVQLREIDFDYTDGVIRFVAQ